MLCFEKPQDASPSPQESVAANLQPCELLIPEPSMGRWVALAVPFVWSACESTKDTGVHSTSVNLDEHACDRSNLCWRCSGTQHSLDYPWPNVWKPLSDIPYPTPPSDNTARCCHCSPCSPWCPPFQHRSLYMSSVHVVCASMHITACLCCCSRSMCPCADTLTSTPLHPALYIAAPRFS